MGRKLVVDDDVPSVEDRITDARERAAALFLALDAIAAGDGELGNFGHLSLDGYRGFRALARGIYADITAIETALNGEPPDPEKYAGQLCWPAPEVE